jgi:hypothetical protein
LVKNRGGWCRPAGTSVAPGKAGVLVNACHDQSVAGPTPAVANWEAADRTALFLDGYLAAGGKADHLVLQTWQPYPDRSGAPRPSL